MNIIVPSLQNRGVYGNFALIEEFACDLFPFDSDLMSMELESAFKVRYPVHTSALCMYVCMYMMFKRNLGFVCFKVGYLILTVKRKYRVVL